MKEVYGKRYGCECRTITKNELKQKSENVIKNIEWADIIYEGGGNTLDMIGLWKETGFDSVLKKAWKSRKSNLWYFGRN